MNNKDIAKVAVAATVGTVIIAETVMVNSLIKHNHKLEDDLYLKQQNEMKATDHYQSTLNIKTLQTKFNSLHEYPVLKDNEISMDHQYNYTEYGALGVQRKIELNGSATVQYDVVVRFDTAIVTAIDHNHILVQIQQPYLDEASVHMKNNSLIMKNQDFNFWANKKDGTQAQKLYMESFNDSAVKKVKELYKEQNKQLYANKAAISEVHALVRTLNLSGCTVSVEIIK